MSTSSVKLQLRPSNERGHADHGWLHTFHTFSFAMYQDPDHEQFGSLRVINEDRVEAGEGFGTHGHREFEIWSYITQGELTHQDSMGNKEVMKRGDVQMTSAGTGIRHSEYNYGSQQVHFLQIWALPNTPHLTPKYYTRHFSDAEKTDTLVRVVAPVGDSGVSDERETSGPAPVHTGIAMYATLLSPGNALKHTFTGSKGFVHVVQVSGYNTGKASGAEVTLNGELPLREGDGARAWASKDDALELKNTGDRVAEVLVFDLE